MNFIWPDDFFVPCLHEEKNISDQLWSLDRVIVNLHSILIKMNDVKPGLFCSPQKNQIDD